jgi:DNA-binding SARP family transcriptional activator
VSSLVIRLLGPPEIERDGIVVAPPRGRKAWAVLAYVALAERPVGRARLAGLVFGDADDPRGALRWTLAQLRRALGVADALCEAVLRDAARRALAVGDPLDAGALASRALALNRFDDGAHELLVRCLARAGEVGAAREQADACDALFRRELGRAPASRAARRSQRSPVRPLAR